MAKPEYISATEAAQLLGVSRMRVNQLLNDGKLDGLMVGGRWIVDAASVRRRKESLGDNRS